MSIKTRVFKEKNYKGIFFKNKTIRIALDPTKPIQELDYPEFYDLKITDKCDGNCDFCYMDSLPTSKHFDNIVEKINSYFGSMTENQRPFQWAIGGGEPTEHPEFINLLKASKELNILPNYTTNGMWIDYATEFQENLISATQKYCGGVAVSCHPHLKDYWEEAANIYIENEVMLNFHIIISDKKSIDEFAEIYDKWKGKVDYFVLLPYSDQGRASKKEIDWEYLLTKLPDVPKDIAFGANFYPYLMKGGHGIQVSLYEPEIMSKYISLEANGLMYKSSFSDSIIKEGFLKS